MGWSPSAGASHLVSFPVEVSPFSGNSRGESGQEFAIVPSENCRVPFRKHIHNIAYSPYLQYHNATLMERKAIYHIIYFRYHNFLVSNISNCNLIIIYLYELSHLAGFFKPDSKKSEKCLAAVGIAGFDRKRHSGAIFQLCYFETKNGHLFSKNTVHIVILKGELT